MTVAAIQLVKASRPSFQVRQSHCAVLGRRTPADREPDASHSRNVSPRRNQLLGIANGLGGQLLKHSYHLTATGPASLLRSPYGYTR